MSGNGKEQSEGYAERSQRTRATPPAGATMPLDELYYPQLYQHSRQLGSLARWNGRGIIAAAGVLAVGGAVGALAAGMSLGSKGVIACLAGGIPLLLGALFIGRADIASARDVKLTFDQTLSMYKQQPEIQAIHEHLESQLPSRPTGLVDRCRDFFNL